MYSFDDILIRPRYNFSQNVDYLCNEQSYNLDNMNLIKCLKCTYNQRLTNVCWRRIYKNLYNLKETNPFEINWDKNSDITWLFGPKFEPEEEPKKEVRVEEKESAPVEVETPLSSSSFTDYSSEDDVFDSDSDVSSVSSIDSGYIADYAPSSVINTKIKKIARNTSYDDFYQLKSILKSSPYPKNTNKKVVFNYKINSREIISGMSFDYDYLDEHCL